jgi:hypothetical protein
MGTPTPQPRSAKLRAKNSPRARSNRPWDIDLGDQPGDQDAHDVLGLCFQGENLDRNLQLVDHLRTLAESKGLTVPQVAIAWVLHGGDDIVPLVGSRTRAQLAEASARDAAAACVDDALRMPADLAETYMKLPWHQQTLAYLWGR